MMKIPLHDYQIYAKDFMLSHPYCGLFLKMGTGKTSIVLEALWELNPTCHVLIIAPKTIARSTWLDEIHKWGMNLRTKSLIVNEKGKKLSRKKRLEIYDQIPTDKPTVYFINREMVTDLVSYMGNRWCFPIVVIDESQSFKSHSSQRFKAMKTVRPYLQRVTLLTGSPTPKGLMDLWSQIWLLDMGQRLGQTITQYRNNYFNPGLIVNNYPVTWYPKPEAEEYIYERIRDLVISIKNTNLQLPSITYNNVYAYMDDEQTKRYKEFKTTYVLDLADGEQIEAANAAVLSAKLSQMASGAIYTAKKSHEFETIHTLKLELCEYIINNTDGPVIIAYHFYSDMKMLLDYLPEHDIPTVVFDGSPEMTHAWNARNIPVMLLQPASCGFGLNLQDGGETLIWYTIPWSLEQYEQTNARLYRQGQKNPVMIHHLITKHTMDERILKSIETKDFSQQALLDAIDATLQDNI